MAWTIEAKIYPVTRLGAHLYLEIFDDDGKRVTQLNGLATDRKTGKSRSVGIPGDALNVYSGRKFVLHDTVNATRDTHPHEGRVLFSGSKEGARKALAAATREARAVNRADLSYKLWSQNSNTVFCRLVEAMAKAVPVDMDAARELAAVKKITPGLKEEFVKTAAAKKPPRGTSGILNKIRRKYGPGSGGLS